jgi:5-methylthioadenosine/S-adenosylhomocysteine deaminase
VGERKEIVKDNPREEVRDLGEAILLPGFVNVHTHLEITAFRGVEDNLPLLPWIIDAINKAAKNLDHEDFIISTSLGCLEALKSGITCVANAGTSQARGGSFIAIVDSGLRGVFYQELWDGFKRDPDEVLEETLSLVKEMQRSGSKRVEVGISPHSPYSVSEELFKLVNKTSLKMGLPLCTHLAESNEEVKFLMHGSGEIAEFWRKEGVKWKAPGLTPVQYLDKLGVLNPNVLAAHCVHLTEGDIKILARRNVAVAHCPKSNAKLADGIAPLPKLMDARIRIGLGTDSTASNNVLDMFEEMRCAIFIQRALHQTAPLVDAKQVLEMATIDGAKALGMEDKIGSLEQGKKADLIAVALGKAHTTPLHDPTSTLIYCAHQTDVTFVMVDGKIVVDDGEVKTLDEQKILKKAERLRGKLEGAKSLKPSDRINYIQNQSE